MRLKNIFLLLLLATAVQAQIAIPMNSASANGEPLLRWVVPDFLLSTTECKGNFTIERSIFNDGSFQKIQTYLGYNYRNDSLFLECMDTTLQEKHFYEYKIHGNYCGQAITSNTNLLAHNHDFIPTPQIVYINALNVSESKELLLEWRLNYTESIRAIEIFRKNPKERTFTMIASVAGNKTFIKDEVDLANEFYDYQIVVIDFFGNRYKSVITSGISSFKEKPFPPQDVTAQSLDTGIHLKWRRLGENILGYHIYRKLGPHGPFRLIDTTIYAQEETIEYTDSDPICKKHEKLAYKIHSVSDGFVESDASEVLVINQYVQVDIPAPTKIDVYTDSIGRYNVVWTAMDHNQHIYGYKVLGIAKGGEDEVLAILPLEQNFASFPKNIQNTYKGISVKTIDSRKRDSHNSKTIHFAPDDIVAENFLITITPDGTTVRLNWTNISTNHAQLNLYRSTNNARIDKIASIPPGTASYIDHHATLGNIHVYYLTLLKNDGSEVPLNDGAIIRL